MILPSYVAVMAYPGSRAWWACSHRRELLLSAGTMRPSNSEVNRTPHAAPAPDTTAESYPYTVTGGERVTLLKL